MRDHILTRIAQKRIPRALVRLTAAAASMACVPMAHASVIYSNIQPNDAFYGGWSILNIPPSPYYNYREVGLKFVVPLGADVELGSATAPMSLSTCYLPTLPGSCQPLPAGATYSAWLNVFSDNQGAPGSLLARSSTATLDTAKFVNESFAFKSGTFLKAGATYWLAADSPPSGVSGVWYMNAHGVLGAGFWVGSYPSGVLNFAEYNNGPGTLTPAIKIMSAVPEPAAWLMLALGGSLLLGAKARLRLKSTAPFSAA